MGWSHGGQHLAVSDAFSKVRAFGELNQCRVIDRQWGNLKCAGEQFVVRIVDRKWSASIPCRKVGWFGWRRKLICYRRFANINCKWPSRTRSSVRMANGSWLRNSCIALCNPCRDHKRYQRKHNHPFEWQRNVMPLALVRRRYQSIFSFSVDVSLSPIHFGGFVERSFGKCVVTRQKILPARRCVKDWSCLHSWTRGGPGNRETVRWNSLPMKVHDNSLVMSSWVPQYPKELFPLHMLTHSK